MAEEEEEKRDIGEVRGRESEGKWGREGEGGRRGRESEGEGGRERGKRVRGYMYIVNRGRKREAEQRRERKREGKRANSLALALTAQTVSIGQCTAFCYTQ